MKTARHYSERVTEKEVFTKPPTVTKVDTKYSYRLIFIHNYKSFIWTNSPLISSLCLL
jgi:hypothetical protein